MISAADRAFVAALSLNRAGLKVDPDKPYLIESRLAPVARREGYSSSHEFVTALRDRADDRQCWAAVEAMALAETPALSARVELFASDLSEQALEKAQAGIYSQFEVQRGLPARSLVRHFEKIGDAFALSPRIRQLVRWRRVNLMDDLGRNGRFDLVLCRGALGQFAPEAQAQVLDQLAGVLAPGGRLVLGLKDDAGGGFTRVGLGVYADRREAVRSAAAA